MAMPSGRGGIDPGAGSGMLNADARELMLVCHIDMLSEPSAPAFGKETKCPAGIQGNSRFALQNSPSLSVLLRLYPGHKINVNQGQSRSIKPNKGKKNKKILAQKCTINLPIPSGLFGSFCWRLHRAVFRALSK